MAVNRQPSDEISCLAGAFGAWTSTPLKTTGIIPLTHTSVLGVACIIGEMTNAETAVISLVASAAADLSTPTVVKSVSLAAHADENDNTVYFFDWDLDDHIAAKPYIGITMTASAAAGNVGSIVMLGCTVRSGGATRHNLAALMLNDSATPTDCIGV